MILDDPKGHPTQKELAEKAMMLKLENSLSKRFRAHVAAAEKRTAALLKQPLGLPR